MKKLILIFACCLGILTSGLPVRASSDVSDGSFENFDDTWQCDDNCLEPVNYYFIFSADAYDEITYAYLFHDAGIYQDLTVPTHATSISFWYDNQPDDQVPEDGSFTVYLLNPNDNSIYMQELFDEQSDGWINKSVTIPTALQGQSVRLYISNTTGYNRIDYLQFTNAADALADMQQIYPTVKMHILSANGNAVKDASVFVKHNGERLSLTDVSTLETSTKLTTNKKGRTHQFVIQQALSGSETVKICVKKSGVTECVKVSPAIAAVTSYDFQFSSKKVE